MLNVVCVNCGEKYSDDYVNRLYYMAKRHISTPFTFTCFTDRSRNLEPGIIQLDTVQWGLEGWYNKLKLFDSKAMPYESMLYLDLSLVIRQSLEPLVEYVQDKPFVALRDWSYDVINSCVMWISRNPMTQKVWEDYASGQPFLEGNHGDQDCIYASLVNQGVAQDIPYFPPEWIVSYKQLHKVYVFRSKEEARSKVMDALIIKFHGHPRQHEMLTLPGRFRWIALQQPRYLLRDWNFLAREVKEWWK